MYAGTVKQTMYLKLPQVALEPFFCFYVKPEVFLGFDTSKKCAISVFLGTVV